MLFVLITMLLAAQADPPEAPLRVVSFNIRFDNPADGPDAWPNRAAAVGGFLRFHEVDLVGVQEALLHQLEELDAMMPEHGWLGVGRDDGREAGEFSAIFYRRERFDVMDSGTFWLSETPSDTGSVGWDAAITRVATWAHFRDRNTGETFHMLNTHFDHVGETARIESARLIVRRLESMADGGPVIFTGDVNATPGAPPLEVLLGEDSPLRDAMRISEVPHYGPASTWNGFREVVPERRIDFVMASHHFGVRRHAHVTDRIDGRFLSDHLPVFSEFYLTIVEAE